MVNESDKKPEGSRQDDETEVAASAAPVSNDTKVELASDSGTHSEDEGGSGLAEMTLAVLPLRDIVVFPHMIVPLFVGREKSVRALEAVTKEDKQILLVAQRNASQDDPTADDIYRCGTDLPCRHAS